MDRNYAKYSDLELTKLLGVSGQEQQEAFAEIYTRYSQTVYLYCLKMLGNDAEADDVYQDVFVKFVTHIRENHKEMDNIVSYLVGMARNFCINLIRSKQVQYKYKAEEPDYQKPFNYENKQLLELVERELEELDTESKEIFVMRIYQGMSYQEIGKICGVSESGAKNKFWRAKEKIRVKLGPIATELNNPRL
ncbi:MAG: hypothetical protein Kapaf2KO_22860 [Candidatus Kapaibacteriales bacterium]